ncbi:MAG TPA: flagellar protein FlaG [Thermodesulfobacteriota bacterium]|nr:flagellar protein FlaG [Thermodesulfobacteriota bacterium]
METLPIQESVPIGSPPASPNRETEKAQGKKPTPPVAERRGKKRESDEENLKAVVEGINNFLRDMQYSLQFVVDRKMKQVVVKVLDGDGKLVRQIPPEEMVSLSQCLGGSNGMILNEILG